MKLAVLFVALSVQAADLGAVKRIYVDRLNGDQSAAQIRDMLINALQTSSAFILTENQERADAVLKGSAEDIIFTDTFQTSEGLTARASVGARGRGVSRTGPLGIAVGDTEATRIQERKHEAVAAVRLVNKDGDVIWATTQESLGGKFRGASADVADKVVKQLLADREKARGSTPATR